MRKNLISKESCNIMPYNQKLKSNYLVRLEISFIIVLMAVIAVFYFNLGTSKKTARLKKEDSPHFTIVDIPQTRQIHLKKNIRPLLQEPENPVDDEEFLDTLNYVLIADEPNADSSVGAILYYSDIPLVPPLKDFNPDSLNKKSDDPLFTYKQYLSRRLATFNVPVRVQKDDYQDRTRRGVQMMDGLSIPFSSIFGSSGTVQVKRKISEITFQDMIDIEPYINILSRLWQRKSQTLFELYRDESIKQKATVVTLQGSMSFLVANGWVKYQAEESKEAAYSTVYSRDEMIELFNRFIAQNEQDRARLDKLQLIRYMLVKTS
jgi:predicted transcriptional regulator